MREYYECPNCYELKVVVEQMDNTEIYRCESCGCHYEVHEWDELHEDVYSEYENCDEEIWDKID